MSPQLQPIAFASTATSTTSTITLLGRALDQNEAVKDTVEQSADELLVISAVLKQALPEHVQTGEVARALQKTDELESRIQESVEDLAQVNQVLAQEICERVDLERELAATKAALAQAKGQFKGRFFAK